MSTKNHYVLVCAAERRPGAVSDPAVHLRRACEQWLTRSNHRATDVFLAPSSFRVLLEQVGGSLRHAPSNEEHVCFKWAATIGVVTVHRLSWLEDYPYVALLQHGLHETAVRLDEWVPKVPIDWGNIKKVPKSPGPKEYIKPLTVSAEEIERRDNEAMAEAMEFLTKPVPSRPIVGKVTLQTAFGPITMTSDPRLPPGWIAPAPQPAAPPADPLDQLVDEVSLRDLLEMSEAMAQERDVFGLVSWRSCDPWTWTPDQRAAVSAHWSAQLRARVEASREAERSRVLVDLQDEP